MSAFLGRSFFVDSVIFFAVIFNTKTDKKGGKRKVGGITRWPGANVPIIFKYLREVGR